MSAVSGITIAAAHPSEDLSSSRRTGSHEAQKAEQDADQDAKPWKTPASCLGEEPRRLARDRQTIQCTAGRVQVRAGGTDGGRW